MLVQCCQWAKEFNSRSSKVMSSNSSNRLSIQFKNVLKNDHDFMTSRFIPNTDLKHLFIFHQFV